MYCLWVIVLVDDATISVQDEQNSYSLDVVLELILIGRLMDERKYCQAGSKTHPHGDHRA